MAPSMRLSASPASPRGLGFLSASGASAGVGRSWRCSANQNGSTTTSDGADRFRCPRELVLSWRAGNLSLEYRGPPLVECSPRDHLQPQVGEPRPSCWHTDPTAPVQEGEGPNRGQHPPSDRAVAQDSRGRWEPPDSGDGRSGASWAVQRRRSGSPGRVKHACVPLGQEDRVEPAGV